MTCKNCIHYDLCKYNTYQEAKYFGKDEKVYITIDNHSACKFFKNKTYTIYCEDERAFEKVKEAVEKQKPKNHFKNECECIVDYEMLYKAIDNKCKSENCYLHNEYRIVLRNGYPAVCINRQRYYVHILIGEVIYGKIRKSYVIHHKDKNKLNAMPDNLELMTNLEHSKIHGNERLGIDLRSVEGKANSSNSAREATTRKDVTAEKVAELRNKGLTIPEIAKELNCGINTVNRRLGMKDY